MDLNNAALRWPSESRFRVPNSGKKIPFFLSDRNSIGGIRSAIPPYALPRRTFPMSVR